MNEKKVDFHGGNIYKIYREKGMKEILDYSSNINPYGLPKKFEKAVIENLSVLEKYPDPDYVELREEIAKTNKVELKNIIVGNGATEIIFLYMKVLKAKKILIVSPTFGEYERAMKATLDDIQVDYFKLEEAENFVLNIEKIKTELQKKYDLLVICNPNNPTGQFLLVKELEKILEKCTEVGTKLFVDEAFVEFVEDWREKSVIKTGKNKKNLFVLRAFTKFFAIPGLRLGYGICFDDEFMTKMLEKKEPWSVNNIAELAGKILLQDKEYIEKTNNWIKIEKKYMYENLKEIEGLKTYKTEINFILVKIKNEYLYKVNAQILREKMLEKGILIRDASNFVYLNDNYFRLAVKDRKNNVRVLEALKEIFENIKREKREKDK